MQLDSWMTLAVSHAPDGVHGSVISLASGALGPLKIHSTHRHGH